jgi:hypothetical protein
MLSDFDSVKAFVDKVIKANVIHYMGVCTVHSEVEYLVRHMNDEGMS